MYPKSFCSNLWHLLNSENSVNSMTVRLHLGKTLVSQLNFCIWLGTLRCSWFYLFPFKHKISINFFQLIWYPTISAKCLFRYLSSDSICCCSTHKSVYAKIRSLFWVALTCYLSKVTAHKCRNDDTLNLLSAWYFVCFMGSLCYYHNW